MTNVFIVADVRIHRRGYRALLQGSKGIRILGASTREDAPELISAKRPDVVLLDVTTAGQPTIIRTILQHSRRAKVIVIGVDDNESAFLSWMERGASDCISISATETELLSAIADVTTGDLRCSPKFSRKLLERVNELVTRDGKDRPIQLTDREKEVTHLVAEGLSNKEIASRLSISPSTVKNHVHNVLEKTQVHRRAQAAARFNSDYSNKPRPQKI